MAGAAGAPTAGAAGRELPQPLGRGDNGGIGPGVELLAQQSLVGLCEAERAGPVARCAEPLHVAYGDPGVERLRLGELPPPAGRRHDLAPAGRIARQRLQRRGVPLRPPAPLLLHPVLELGRLVQVESVEERPPVRADRPREVTRFERRGEFRQIGRKHGGVEPKVGRAEEHLLGAEATAEAVEELGQAVGRLVGWNLRPEPRVDLVAAEPAPPPGGKKREQGERLPLTCSAAARSTVPEYRRAAENLELQHPNAARRGRSGAPAEVDLISS